VGQARRSGLIGEQEGRSAGSRVSSLALDLPARLSGLISTLLNMSSTPVPAPLPAPVSTPVQACCATPLGPVRLLASAHGLAGLWFEDQKHRPEALDTEWPSQPQHPLLVRAQTQLAQYFAGQRPHFDLPLDLGPCTALQQRVWQALLEIAPGDTCSYGELARRIGQPRAVRAVAGAVGRNRLSIFVPCHRVLGSDGSLTGYAGGLARKRALLELEGHF
jgi:methylated-DNA-[protein]-cysteine S-methyltransferase